MNYYNLPRWLGWFSQWKIHYLWKVGTENSVCWRLQISKSKIQNLMFDHDLNMVEKPPRETYFGIPKGHPCSVTSNWLAKVKSSLGYYNCFHVEAAGCSSCVQARPAANSKKCRASNELEQKLHAGLNMVKRCWKMLQYGKSWSQESSQQKPQRGPNWEVS